MHRFAAALSTERQLADAVRDCAATASRSLDSLRPDLALVFVSMHHRSGFATLSQEVARATGARLVIGCTGESIIGGAREVEHQPALSIWLAHLPGVRLIPFHLNVESGPDEKWQIDGMPDLKTLLPEGRDLTRQSLLVFGEPYTFPAPQWLQTLNEQMPGLLAYGGMASGATAPGQHRLFLGDEAHLQGAVGVLIEGVRVRNLVSQGCRPVGPAMVITKAHENVIEELAGKPAVERLQEIFLACDEKERALLQSSLHLGQVIDEHISNPGRGDFLMKNVMGIERSSGSLRVGDVMRRGRTVRFHVRDSASADDDLRKLLEKARSDASAAALLFSCNGRGSRMFTTPDHDAGSVQSVLGDLPLAGFFAAGEIGPVGGRNFLHGFTASLAIFGGE